MLKKSSKKMRIFLITKHLFHFDFQWRSKVYQEKNRMRKQMNFTWSRDERIVIPLVMFEKKFSPVGQSRSMTLPNAIVFSAVNNPQTLISVESFHARACLMSVQSCLYKKTFSSDNLGQNHARIFFHFSNHFCGEISHPYVNSFDFLHLQLKDEIFVTLTMCAMNFFLSFLLSKGTHEFDERQTLRSSLIVSWSRQFSILSCNWKSIVFWLIKADQRAIVKRQNNTSDEFSWIIPAHTTKIDEPR